MKEQALSTRFAPAERSTPENLERQVEAIGSMPLLSTLLDAIPNVLTVLNKQRQIVYANHRLFEQLGIPDWERIRGKRPGEVLECIHSDESPGGCGTTEFCRECGAVNAVLESQQGLQSVKECRILTKSGVALDLQVWATQYKHEGESFTIFSVFDISSEKRRQVLERTFFHDVLNTAGLISGLSDLLGEEEAPEEITHLSNMVFRSSERLIEEIQSQRQLLAAERGDLDVSNSEVSSRALLHEIAELYSGHDAAKDRTIIVDDTSQDIALVTDPVLLRRVIGNMVKNALEATPADGTVTLFCSEESDGTRFSVHNPTLIPRNVQLQIFQRSFSTKGTGRGIGTYSMKLFAEQYLGGNVSFKTSKEKGTTFSVKLPLTPDS